jgi:hypothetical protein
MQQQPAVAAATVSAATSASTSTSRPAGGHDRSQQVVAGVYHAAATNSQLGFAQCVCGSASFFLWLTLLVLLLIV